MIRVETTRSQAADRQKLDFEVTDVNRLVSVGDKSMTWPICLLMATSQASVRRAEIRANTIADRPGDVKIRPARARYNSEEEIIRMRSRAKLVYR